MNEGIAQLKKKGFTVAGHLAVGEPVEEICRLAADLKCDLIVVGHKQKAAFGSRWWRGSVGKTLLDHAPCSIFVAQTRDRFSRPGPRAKPRRAFPGRSTP